MPAGIRDSGSPPALANIEGLHRDLQKQVDYAARTSKKLARGLFHAMARFGPKLDREQLLLSRFVGIATELFRDQRDLFVCAIQDGPRRICRRSFVGRELFLQFGEDCESTIILPEQPGTSTSAVIG